MNKVMYINYTIAIYCLNQVLQKEIDESLRIKIDDFINYLQAGLDNYAATLYGRKIPSIQVENMPWGEQLKTTFRVIRLVAGTSKDESVQEELNELDIYLRKLMINDKLERKREELRR